MKIAVLADIHGVLPALDAVLTDPAIRTADRIIALGDIAAGPQPNEVMHRLLALGDRVEWLIGNADRELIEYRRGRRTEMPDAIAEFAAQTITDQNIAVLETLPLTLHLTIEGLGPTLFCHATPRADDDIILVDSPYPRWDEVFTAIAPEIETIVCGHTHMPFARLVRGRMVINPGSIGMTYGRSGPHWAMLGPGVTFLRSSMDLNEACRQICGTSAFPDIVRWVDDVIRSTESDKTVLTLFSDIALTQ
ncbi:MAG: metallophosphoesterase family protein [Acidiphilium sp.]|nr:metallophosphoesterase family protein [Acidiphilium sp.]MDD4934428.1 metallophosphoesterase family protein [Acidiphilium sp.]